MSVFDDRFGDDVSQEITQDILRTPGYPKVINQFATWMVGINPVAKFALCTRPLNVTIEHLLNLSPLEEVSDAHGPAIGKRGGAGSVSQNKSAHATEQQQLSTGTAHPDLQASACQDATAPCSSSSCGDPFPGGPAGKAHASKVWSKALGRTVSRTVVTSLVVLVSILMPNFERVMAFLGVESLVSLPLSH
ncbi:uncharacterized protein VP01_10893g1 [Puccinia sorghi]|uniref:Uncharacterized protein n=1 Tax=Puccinia sorghi TaxID=27349 RepID=A0A0L6VT54_9BASI|nr:uncharacterized protein VP01_10893g1 [Puccinia sorghi]